MRAVRRSGHPQTADSTADSRVTGSSQTSSKRTCSVHTRASLLWFWLCFSASFYTHLCPVSDASETSSPAPLAQTATFILPSPRAFLRPFCVLVFFFSVPHLDRLFAAAFFLFYPMLFCSRPSFLPPCFRCSLSAAPCLCLPHVEFRRFVATARVCCHAISPSVQRDRAWGENEDRTGRVRAKGRADSISLDRCYRCMPRPGKKRREHRFRRPGPRARCVPVVRSPLRRFDGRRSDRGTPRHVRESRTREPEASGWAAGSPRLLDRPRSRSRSLRRPEGGAPSGPVCLRQSRAAAGLSRSHRSCSSAAGDVDCPRCAVTGHDPFFFRSLPRIFASCCRVTSHFRF